MIETPFKNATFVEKSDYCKLDSNPHSPNLTTSLLLLLYRAEYFSRYQNRNKRILTFFPAGTLLALQLRIEKRAIRP